MATIKIKSADGNKEYTLGFTKKTIKEMAGNGFNISEAVDNYVVGVPKLFEGAFLRYHRQAKQSEIDSVWESIGEKPAFIEALVTMYNEQLEELFGEPEDEKKAVWEVVK